MSNMKVGILIGSGVAAGIGLTYAVKVRRRRRTLIGRARRQAAILRRRALMLSGVAAGIIEAGRKEALRRKKLMAECVGPVRLAYQKVAG